MTYVTSHSLQHFAAQEQRAAATDRRVAALVSVAAKHKARADDAERRLSATLAGFKALVAHLGPDADAAVRTGMARHTGLIKQADEQNPAQPIPEPAPEAPFATTLQAEMPEAMADVQAPGMIPGVNNDVAPDVTTTVFTPGADIPDRGIGTLIDVTRPVEGTQGPISTSQVRTETDVRAGNPMNPNTAFPLDGPFAQQQRVGSLGDTPEPTPMEQAQTRLFAAQAAARIQIKAGVADTNDEVALTQRIAQSSDPLEVIQRETDNFTRAYEVSQRAQHTASTQEVPRGVVPRTARGVGRTMSPLTASAPSQSVFNRTASADIPAGYSNEADDLSALLVG